MQGIDLSKPLVNNSDHEVDLSFEVTVSVIVGIALDPGQKLDPQQVVVSLLENVTDRIDQDLSADHIVHATLATGLEIPHGRRLAIVQQNQQNEVVVAPEPPQEPESLLGFAGDGGVVGVLRCPRSLVHSGIEDLAAFHDIDVLVVDDIAEVQRCITADDLSAAVNKILNQHRS